MENGHNLPLPTPQGSTENQMGDKRLEETLQRLKQKAVLGVGRDFLCSLPASNVGVKASVDVLL